MPAKNKPYYELECERCLSNGEAVMIIKKLNGKTDKEAKDEAIIYCNKYSSSYSFETYYSGIIRARIKKVLEVQELTKDEITGKL